MIEDEIYEEQFFKCLDQLKLLLFPDKWNTNIFDYSKNELLAIVFIYRRQKVNISEIAEYLMSPLNTVTGVINRLEKKGIVERIRNKEDKRIVNICLTNKGLEEYNEGKKEIIRYFKEVYSELSEEERRILFNVFTKIIKIFTKIEKEEENTEVKVKKIKKIVIE